MNYIDEWLYVAQAYNGTDGFADGTAIEKFGRESDDAYDARKEISNKEYENIFVSKVSRYCGYLLKKTPYRESAHNLIQPILADINRRGESANVFISNFTKNAKARGVNLVLVDSPKETGTDMQEQINNRLLPYVVEILPERVLEYKLNEFGAFEYVAFSDSMDNSTYGNIDTEDIVRYYDTTEWRVYDKEGIIIDSGLHGLSVCPVLIFSEKGEFESLGEFSQLAGMSKRLFNLDSEEKQLLRGQTFSLLTVFTEKGSTPEITIGTDSVLMYSGDHPPTYISSDASQAGTYATKRIDIKESMDRVAYDVSTSMSAESGISLEIKFEGLNSSLNSFAQRVEDLERRVWDLICIKIGIPLDSITIVYNMDFSISDLSSELDTLERINAIVDLPQYKAAKLKGVIKEDLKSSEDETLDSIFEEIEDMAKMTEVIE